MEMDGEEGRTNERMGTSAAAWQEVGRLLPLANVHLIN